MGVPFGSCHTLSETGVIGCYSVTSVTCGMDLLGVCALGGLPGTGCTGSPVHPVLASSCLLSCCSHITSLSAERLMMCPVLSGGCPPCTLSPGVQALYQMVGNAISPPLAVSLGKTLPDMAVPILL